MSQIRKQGQRLRRVRPVDPAALTEIRALLGDAPRQREYLIEHLHRIQDRFGHIDAAHLTALAREMGLAPVELYETASFYHHFDLVKEGEAPPPPVTVRVCDSISCELAGAGALADALERGLGDGVRVQRVPCVGRCDRAPVAVVGEQPVEAADPARVRASLPLAGEPAPIPDRAIGYADYRSDGGYRLLQACVAGEREPGRVIAELERSGLRGLGGAGFPAARKWRILQRQPAPRLLVANLDEGEPGTFKDRSCLERDPHRFLEGLLIAAWAVEAEAAYIYLRDEYAGCRRLLQRELERLRADPPVPLPPIHLRRGAGSYVCGEESALIESLEGHRGLPRQRPPYVAERGLFGRPTLVHNLETLFRLREILERGGDWFAGHGMNGRSGLRSFSVSGRVRRPGVHLVPAGITLRQLIDDHCGGMLPGHRLRAWFPGGASGGILPASLDHLPLDFDTLQEHGCFIGSGAIIVLSDRDDVRRAALNAMRFFAQESCGQCTPCREGTRRLAAMMAQERWDVALMEELATVMEDASICGLGQAAPNPLRCLLRHFPEVCG
ncbi:MAG TPA: NADH-quinone oxidoreductase subunit F [Sedimenticola thiotaurini]|uniref:NADH-quinone oxidoreductase subunit F n=1 Tax=Sedimenticola thiotaurini TaxID=1543721 RepID=A0A831W800_9GAMM|nr:NADH-quinone oxidoreductase subunit F [Sedimenticola thiotaurini]